MPVLNRQISRSTATITNKRMNQNPKPIIDPLLNNLVAFPDPDPKIATSPSNLSRYKNNLQPYKAKGQHKTEASVLELEEEESLDPTKHSFSQALKECQNRRIRSESHSFPKRKTTDKQRPASIDFNGAIISPRFIVGSLTSMKKSPGTPNYRYPKGWSSERVPMPAHSSRRYPFNNGRAIPSKWEDAEKWIVSPIFSENADRSSVPPPNYRRPKSKSGPLGPPAYLSLSSAASPLNPCFDSGRVRGFNGGSPFLNGVFATDRGGSCCSGTGGGGGGGDGRSSLANAEPYILRSASIHEWSDTMVESCSSQDEKLDGNRETSTMLHSTILRKDVATQMSPDGSTQSSPKARHSFSRLPSAHTIDELERLSKLEVRDVQVDDQVTVTRWSKKHVARGSDRRSMNIIEWKKRTVEAKADSSSGWGVAETAKCISRSKREDAKITAWENLQKAKAEAAIRKLEMKLEKKRSSSMEKILSKLRSAQRKVGEMRSAVATGQSQQIEKNANIRISYFRKIGRISSLSGCFTC